MYYLYHIPGKKIGVTRDLNTRVTLIQGYKKGEYEVLEQSEDIDYISDREIELQQSYGYKVDRQKYKNLYSKKYNKMKINVTEQTSTFPFPLNKLKGNLMDNLGLAWYTEHGRFEINQETVKWIMANAKTSMYNDQRSYIYNKAYYEAFISEPMFKNTDQSVFDNIRDWAETRGIYKSGDSKTQYVKLIEETGELAKALLNNDKEEIVDAIGDIVVVLTNLAKLENLQIEDCVEAAYNVIALRQGKMINGTFVKNGN
jgi:NTP pyrophosphatase (non-canonical NTP hydrolase)